MENFFSCIAVNRDCWLSMRSTLISSTNRTPLWALWIAPGRVDERRGLVRGVAHEELGHHQVLLAVAGVAARDVDDRRDENAEQDDLRRFRVEAGIRSPPVVRHDHAEADDEEHDRHDHRGLLLPPLHRLRLLGVDDLAPLAGGHDTDLRLVRVFRVVVDDDILKLVPREELGHRAGEHRLARARIADEHHMPLLLRGLPDDLDGPLLADHLVHEPIRDLDLGRASEIHLGNPRIYRGQLVRFSRGLHHVLTGPARWSRSNTRAFYLNTLT